MASTDYLWQRGNQWYLKLAIPRPMQHLFPSSTGKPKSKIVEPLGDSPSVARDEARWRVARYTEIFSQIKLGILTTPQDVAKAMRDGVEPDRALWPGFDEAMRHMRLSPRQIELLRRRNEQIARRFELFGEHGIEGLRLPLDADAPTAAAPAATVTAPTATGETVNQAAEAWFAELARDKSLRGTTLDGHKLRVRAFVDKVGDLPLTDVTRAVASDFLDALDVSVRTRNAYAHTLKCVFKSAGRRGRFSIAEEANPFHEQRTKATGSSYQPFTVTELQTLFDAMPREVRPKKHTPETALPWVALMALYTGMRLEEVAQLTTADVREETANGARVWCIDVHNGGDNKLKNETSARLIPVHSELVRLGLLDYIKALKAGPLFPGLTRRESKGGKIGARVGELFRKKLVALKLKRKGLCFHSFRHTVAGRLDAASVPQSDAARVLGHAVAGMSYGTYNKAGPGLKRVAAVVEQITYDGLKL